MHARCVSRPWHADPVLDSLMQMFVTGKDSMIQKVDRSLALRKTFTQHCNELERGLPRKNNMLVSLHSAKHRFESLATPLGSWVMWLLPLCKTAREITIARTGVEVACAKMFISQLSVYRCVLMAMMADAADDGLEFTRHADSFTAADPATIQEDVYLFLVRIVSLYKEGKIVQILSYTQYMLEMLKTNPVTLPLTVQGGLTWKTIGGAVSDDILQQCFQHMGAWVKLAVRVIRAEFPEWELLQCFWVLDLGEGVVDRDAEERTAAFQKLGKAFKLDPDHLANQVNDHIHVARCFKQQHGTDNLSAWANAVRRTEARRDTALQHPCDHLKGLLYRYATFRACTSRIEQDFSKIADALGDKRLHSLESTEACVTKVVLDKPRDSAACNAIVASAQEPACKWHVD